MDFQRSSTARAAKAILPRIGRVVSNRRFQSAISLGETAAAILQGKGAGSGTWDIDAEVNAAARFLRAGDVVFDVGANRGVYAGKLILKARGIKLTMFEPQRSCHIYLGGILAFGGVKLEPVAIGESVGEATLYASGEADGVASIHPRQDTYFAGQEFKPLTVPMTTIDAYMAEHSIDRVAFMKMDIEGHELAGLKGARQALSGHKIGALSFEFGSSNINSRTYFRDFWDLLTAYGYKISRIVPGGHLSPVDHYSERELEYFGGATNYVAAC